MLGEVIHGYRIERELAGDKGGFGEVFFATHIESGADAVVKVLKPELSALRDVVARFFNEARATASVHHPGIVQIHNVGYHRDRAYLLMERLRGEDLETRLAAGLVPLDRSILFLRQAAGAIGAAHERGIVHRDLKPANLFLVPDPDVIGGERVKVLDFGIAKLTAERGAGQTQGVFGTPAYMSPEQCASTRAVDSRADLYSLGCIFYELVVGRPPFGHGGVELIAAHLRDTPPTPRSQTPWLPSAIEQIILGLLEKEPERRIPSCAKLIVALDEAAAVVGLAGTHSPQRAQQGMSAAPTARSRARSTLGSAADAMTMPRAGRRNVGRWLGVVATIAVGGAVAAVLVATSGPRPSAHEPTLGTFSGTVAALVDAAPVAAAATNDHALAVAPRADGERADPADAAVGEKLNEEGKVLMQNHQPGAAAVKFQQAFTRSRGELRYLFNLAKAQYFMGDLLAARRSAREVVTVSPSSPLGTKAREFLSRIEGTAKEQGLSLPAEHIERNSVRLGEITDEHR
jgi:eukaryotic-like serine/threonine-protein kinase